MKRGFFVLLLCFSCTVASNAHRGIFDSPFGVCSKRTGPLCANEPEILVAQPSENLEILDCSDTHITVKGDQSDSMNIGQFLVYVDSTASLCSPCSVLFRRITSKIQSLDTSSVVLGTEMATFAQIFDKGMFVEAVNEVEIETAIGCPDFHDSNEGLWFQLAPLVPFFSGGADLNDCSSKWLQKNTDGSCLSSDCFVGVAGNASDCIYCGNSCGNGCGSADTIRFDGNLVFFDFGMACCNHDFCYDSNNSKAQCDLDFLSNMLSACLTLPYVVFSVVTGVLTKSLAPALVCPALAFAAFGAVVGFGDASYQRGQENRIAHEQTNVCRAL